MDRNLCQAEMSVPAPEGPELNARAIKNKQMKRPQDQVLLDIIVFRVTPDMEVDYNPTGSPDQDAAAYFDRFSSHNRSKSAMPTEIQLLGHPGTC